MPNVGLWGLKEFDALLFTVDGVPVGGPFNPSLSQIPIDDIDRVEIVKGPQGSLYGVSGFAGMVQVFTRHDDRARGHLTLGGGAFANLHASGDVAQQFSNGASARAYGQILNSDGWQDRTGSAIARGGLSLAKDFGALTSGLDLNAYRDQQRWGSPTPFEAGESVEGFELDRNYAVSGARVQYRVQSAVLRLGGPVLGGNRLENVASYTRDDQTYLRSFPGALSVTGDTLTSEAIELSPVETSVYEDLKLVSGFQLAGDHSLVAGGALTWGKTTADGHGFDFDQRLSAYPDQPGFGDVPIGDNRSFSDERTFFGFYAHDSYTPVPRVTIAGGGRYDATSEKLHTSFEEIGSPVALSDDSRSDGAWSGDLSLLLRAAPAEKSSAQVLNFYVNWKSSFKPAAPNLSEGEQAEILDPEHTHSVEGGMKSRLLNHQLDVNVTVFDMTFDNMVVAILGPGSTPELTNAGKQRFQGAEVETRVAPSALAGVALTAGYAYHDARFVHFTDVTPDGDFEDVSGHRVEMVPRNAANLRLDYHTPRHVGVFGAMRWYDERPLDRAEPFVTAAFTEWDAGVSYDFGHGMLTLTGRNLSDSRHPVTESEIGDAEFYIAPPRRVSGEITFHF